MSKSQQEIAAPKEACKKYQPVLTLTAVAVTATALAAFVIFAYKKGMFYGNTGVAVAITAVLSALLIGTVVLGVVYKTARNMAVFGFYAAFSLLVLLFVHLAQKNDTVIHKTFTVSMLIVLLSTLLCLAAAVIYILRYKRPDKNVPALLNGCLFFISLIFSFYLRGKKDFDGNALYASYIWGISGFAIAVSACICIIVCLLTAEKKVITTKWITYCATFSALSVVCKIMGNAVSFVAALRFSFVYVPWVTAGIVLGPVGGMISALIGDVLGQLILPAGFAGLNPYVVLANTLFPVFPALMYRYCKISREWANILIGMVISVIVCTLGISTYGQWLYYYKDTEYLAYLSTRLIQTIVIGVNYFLVMMMLPALKRAKITNLQFYMLKKQMAD